MFYCFTTRFFKHSLISIVSEPISSKQLLHDIGSAAIENVFCLFCYVPLKEIRDKNPMLAISFEHFVKILQCHSVMQIIFFNYKKRVTLMFTRYIYV